MEDLPYDICGVTIDSDAGPTTTTTWDLHLEKIRNTTMWWPSSPWTWAVYTDKVQQLDVVCLLMLAGDVESNPGPTYTEEELRARQARMAADYAEWRARTAQRDEDGDGDWWRQEGAFDSSSPGVSQAGYDSEESRRGSEEGGWIDVMGGREAPSPKPPVGGFSEGWQEVAASVLSVIVTRQDFVNTDREWDQEGVDMNWRRVRWGEAWWQW